MAKYLLTETGKLIKVKNYPVPHIKSFIFRWFRKYPWRLLGWSTKHVFDDQASSVSLKKLAPTVDDQTQTKINPNNLF